MKEQGGGGLSVERAGEWGRGGGREEDPGVGRAWRRGRGGGTMESGESTGLQASTPDPAYLKWKRKRHPRDSRELGRVGAAGTAEGVGGGWEAGAPGAQGRRPEGGQQGEAARAQPTRAGGAGCRCQQEAGASPALHPD